MNEEFDECSGSVQYIYTVYKDMTSNFVCAHSSSLSFHWRAQLPQRLILLILRASPMTFRI